MIKKWIHVLKAQMIPVLTNFWLLHVYTVTGEGMLVECLSELINFWAPFQLPLQCGGTYTAVRYWCLHGWTLIDNCWWRLANKLNSS